MSGSLQCFERISMYRTLPVSVLNFRPSKRESVSSPDGKSFKSCTPRLLLPVPVPCSTSPRLPPTTLSRLSVTRDRTQTGRSDSVPRDPRVPWYFVGVVREGGGRIPEDRCHGDLSVHPQRRSVAHICTVSTPTDPPDGWTTCVCNVNSVFW